MSKIECSHAKDIIIMNEVFVRHMHEIIAFVVYKCIVKTSSRLFTKYLIAKLMKHLHRPLINEKDVRNLP